MKSKFKTLRTLLLITMVLFSLASCDNKTSGAKMSTKEDSAQEAIDIAMSFKPIIVGKLTDGLTAISSDAMSEIMNVVAGRGYAVMEASGEHDFENPQIVTDFFSQLKVAAKAQMTIIEVCNDGGIIKSDISVKDEKPTITITRVAWKDSEPEITYVINNNLLDLRFTDKGYLIYKRDIPNNTGCSHDGYIEPTSMIRVTPLDKKCREYCKKFISIIGYSRNNLFTTDWSCEDMSGVAINDLFPMLYQASQNVALTLYNCPFKTNTETGFTTIPAKDFETIITDYFNLTSGEVKKLAVYDAKTDTYPIAASEIYDPGYSTPPVPEVTNYKVNEDGTLTLYVDAIDVVNGTDKAFSHAVLIKIEDDGSFKYLANQLYPTNGDILPIYENPFLNIKY